MTRRQEITTTIVIIIAIIIIGIISYFLYKKKQANPALQSNLSEVVNQATKEPEKLPLKQVAVKDVKSSEPVKIDPKILEQMGIKTFSQSFVERWGSYSNHSDYDNFTSLGSLMTEKMRPWANNYAAKEKERLKKYDFYGLTTKVVSSEIAKNENNAAVVNLMCQKQERINNDSAKISYASFELSLVKEKGNWKVDGIK